MIQLSTTEAVTLGIAIVSLAVNVIQWVKKDAAVKGLKSALRSHSTAAYNHLNHVAHLADHIQAALGGGTQADSKALTRALMEATRINGTADAARTEVVAYCQEHLKYTPEVLHVVDLQGSQGKALDKGEKGSS